VLGLRALGPRQQQLADFPRDKDRRDLHRRRVSPLQALRLVMQAWKIGG
jgi:hypothetical protein